MLLESVILGCPGIGRTFIVILLPLSCSLKTSLCMQARTKYRMTWTDKWMNIQDIASYVEVSTCTIISHLPSCTTVVLLQMCTAISALNILCWEVKSSEIPFPNIYLLMESYIVSLHITFKPMPLCRHQHTHHRYGVCKPKKPSMYVIALCCVIILVCMY